MVFLVDPFGLSVVAVVYLIMGYTDYAVVYHVVKYGRQEERYWFCNGFVCSVDSTDDAESNGWCVSQTWQVALVHVIVFLAFISHIRCMTSNPGYVPKSRSKVDFSEGVDKVKTEDVGIDDWSMCNRCETVRPPRAHHCKRCRRCVRMMDHHCPWMNNCVGELNRKYFILFVGYIYALCNYSFLLIVVYWLHDWYGMQTKADTVGVTTVLFLAVIFGLFTGAIAIGQFISAIVGRSGIDVMKHGYGKLEPPKSRMVPFQRMFGTGFFLCWPVPCAAPTIPEPAYSEHIV